MDYEGIIKAIREKTHKAQGDEHEIYENLAFDSHSSFGYGVRLTLYALSQVLGEDKVQKAMQNWLSESQCNGEYKNKLRYESSNNI